MIPAREVLRVRQTCQTEVHMIGPDIEITERNVEAIEETDARLIDAGVCLGGTPGIPILSEYKAYSCPKSFWKNIVNVETYCIKRGSSILRTGPAPLLSPDVPLSYCKSQDGVCRTGADSYLLFQPINTSKPLWKERYSGNLTVEGSVFTVNMYTSSFITTNAVTGAEWERSGTCHNSTRGWIICLERSRQRKERDMRDDMIRAEERSEDTAKLQYLTSRVLNGEMIQRGTCRSMNMMLDAILRSSGPRNRYLESMLHEQKVASVLSGNILLVWKCERIDHWYVETSQNNTFYPSVRYSDMDGVTRVGHIDPLTLELRSHGGPPTDGYSPSTVVSTPGEPYECSNTRCTHIARDELMTLDSIPPQPTPEPIDAGKWFIETEEFHSVDRESAIASHLYKEVRSMSDQRVSPPSVYSSASLDVPFSTPFAGLSILALKR